MLDSYTALFFFKFLFHGKGGVNGQDNGCQFKIQIQSNQLKKDIQWEIDNLV